MGYDARIVARFWRLVDVCKHGRACSDCCWPWKASCTPAGYGQFSFYDAAQYAAIHRPSRVVTTHRFVLELTQGAPLPKGVWALHACNWRRCCNPNPGHVYPGSPAQNAQDRVDAALGAPSWTPPQSAPLPTPALPTAQIALLQFFVHHGVPLSHVAQFLGWPLPQLREALSTSSRVDIGEYASPALLPALQRLVAYVAKLRAYEKSS